MVSPSVKCRMKSWHVAVARMGPCAIPLIIMPHEPQMPSRQSWSNATGCSPRSMRDSFTTSIISRNDMSPLMSAASYTENAPWAVGPACRHTCRVNFTLALQSGAVSCAALLVAALREVDVLELERLLQPFGRPVLSAVLPDGDVRKVFVVAQRLAVRRLIFLPKMRAARFPALERVSANEFA